MHLALQESCKAFPRVTVSFCIPTAIYHITLLPLPQLIKSGVSALDL